MARLAITFILASISFAYSVFADNALTVPDKARLTEFVQQDCGSCHGLTLKGGLGKPLLPEALDHFEAEGVADIILKGIPGTAMPPWRGLLSEKEALWIALALKDGSIAE